MPYEELDLGLRLTIPTNGTRNWGTTLKSTTWTKISQHTHTGDGDGAKIVSDSITDKSITSAKLADNIGFSQYDTANTTAGTTITVDWANGITQFIDLEGASGDVTLSFSNPEAGANYRLIIIQGSTARGLVYPANVLFPQGADHGALSGADPATISEGNDEVDVVKMYYDGTNDNYYSDFDLTYS